MSSSVVVEIYTFFVGFFARLSGIRIPKTFVEVEFNEPADVAEKNREIRIAEFWTAFIKIVRLKGSINGNDPRRWIGFKFGNCIYLDESRIRFALAAQLGNEVPNARRKYGVCRTTVEFMEAASRRGLLVTTCMHPTEGEKNFSAKSALFRVNCKSDSDNRVVGYPAMIVLNIPDELSSIRNLDDAPCKPEVMSPTLGWQFALKQAEKKSA